MNKKQFIAFIFGSTALATSMSFLPLADANANPLVDSYETNKRLYSKTTMPNLEALEVSMIGHGYHELFEDVSDDESDEPSYALKADKKDLKRENPNAKVGNFTTADAIEMARYAQAAYKVINPEESKDIQRFINEGSKVYSLKTLKEEVSWAETAFENQDTGIFVERADGTAVLSFQGSKRLNTWLSDFNPVMQNHENGGRYHGGFLTMYNELEASVWNHIMNFAEKNSYSVEEAMAKITITGHSRGAGCAQVFADIAQRKTGVVSPMITFAAPRALHKKTAGDFNELAKDNHLNILQAKDIVGYAALSAINGGAHIGHKMYLPVSGDSWIHQMGGYRKMLNTMHVMGEVKREVGSATGNTYKFESANEHEDRDLLSEKDNSLQAWVETGIDAVKDPKKAASSILDRASWAVQNPVEAIDLAASTTIQVAKNVGEVALNAAGIAKLALVGTAKKVEGFVKSPSTKAAVVSAANIIVDTSKYVANTAQSLGTKAWNAVKFW